MSREGNRSTEGETSVLGTVTHSHSTPWPSLIFVLISCKIKSFDLEFTSVVRHRTPETHIAFHYSCILHWPRDGSSPSSLLQILHEKSSSEPRDSVIPMMTSNLCLPLSSSPSPRLLHPVSSQAIYLYLKFTSVSQSCCLFLRPLLTFPNDLNFPFY